MKLINLFVWLNTIAYGLNPAKAFNNANNLSKAGKTVRKFIKGVSDFVTNRKPSSTKVKTPKKPTRSSKTPTKNKRHSSKKNLKTARPNKTPTSATPSESENGGFKNFVGQLAIAGVSGGGLTMLQSLTKDDVEYEYEYEYVTTSPISDETLLTTVSKSSHLQFVQLI